jgi:hypothetical protein
LETFVRVVTKFGSHYGLLISREKIKFEAW